MTAEKIFGPATLNNNSAGDVKYELEPSPGGARCKNAVYALKVVAKSGDTAKVTLNVAHGPDGQDMVDHSTPIGTTTLDSTYDPPLVLVGDTDVDTNGQLMEWLHPELTVGATSGDAWVTIELYVLYKPF